MPGLMETVLNLGMNDSVVEGLAARAGERFAWDSYRRFLEMFGSIVKGIDRYHFEDAVAAVKVLP
jgi:pyruvate, orthophosphate dikinase